MSYYTPCGNGLPSLGSLLMSGQAENLAIECEETENLFQRDITGVTHAPRYDASEFGGCSGCQGAVQEIGLVPKTEVGADPKLKQDERALYRIIGGSNSVPVLVPAAVPIVSYESSVFGSGSPGE